MDSYVLKFIDNDVDEKQAFVQFNAPDVSEALVIARLQAAHRDTELWKGGRKLCRLPASRNASARPALV